MEKELKHYGILGMKWGIRRYQPYSTVPRESGKGGKEIGEAAKKKRKLDSMSDEKLFRTLKRDIRSKRASIHGGANRWAVSDEIGEKSQKLRDERAKEYKEYTDSKEYKEWEKKWDRLDVEAEKMANSGKYTVDELNDWWNKKEDEIRESQPDPPKGNLHFVVSYSGEGRKYLNDFLTNGGKDLSIARLEDLGYDRDYAEKLTKRLIKYGRSLGDI